MNHNRLCHSRPSPLKKFYFGAAYYPEHWTPEVRLEDPQRMADAGFNCVRMAEFAWDRMEPREGEYDFSFFDEAIAALGEKGIDTVLCTPTAAPPRWLTLRRPQTLRVDASGQALQHGSRQHCCHSSEIFRDYSRRITEAMARHYRDNPHVVGWQTDNEFLCHFSECYCESCRRGFTEFLRGKYAGDIQQLNRRWGNAFWALSYDRFEDIPLPKVDRPAAPNPSHMLDYYRYLSHAVTVFQGQQVEILRAVQKRWFVFHNGMFRHIDYRGQFGADLDLMGYDTYPFFDKDPDTRSLTHAFNMDRARSWCGNLFVPEHQSGPGGQSPYMLDTPEPGEMRLLSFATVARGADSLLYFRWRTCRFGAEEYWCGILDHDSVPRRRYQEVRQIGAELAKVGPLVLGTSVSIDVGVAAADIEVNDAHSTYPLGLPSHTDIAGYVHRVLLQAGYSVGCVHPADDLSGLKAVVIPHWAVFDPAWAANLSQYVHGGGTLVVGARTATRDMDNQVAGETLPGCLRELCGISVGEYGRQNKPEKRPLELRIGEAVLRSELWYEQLVLEGAEAIGEWTTRHLAGSPGVSRRKWGKGCVFYVGTYMTPPIAQALLPLVAQTASLSPAWPGVPANVHVVRREGDGRCIWFFLNTGTGPAHLPTTPKGVNVLTGEATGQAHDLPVHGVLVIRNTKA